MSYCWDFLSTMGGIYGREMGIVDRKRKTVKNKKIKKQRGKNRYGARERGRGERAAPQHVHTIRHFYTINIYIQRCERAKESYMAERENSCTNRANETEWERVYLRVSLWERKREREREKQGRACVCLRARIGEIRATVSRREREGKSEAAVERMAQKNVKLKTTNNKNLKLGLLMASKFMRVVSKIKPWCLFEPC